MYQNLGDNSTVTLNTTSLSDFTWDNFVRYISRDPFDPSNTFDVNAYGSFTANFKHLPPAVPPEYWIPLYGIIVSSIVGWSIPSIVGSIKSWRNVSKLDYYHREINVLYDDGKLDEEDIEALNNLKRNISDAYSEGKLTSEYYINLKEELSTLYQEIFSKRVDSLNEAPNKEIKEEYLNAIKQDISDAYSKSKINELHYKLLRERISGGE